MYTSLNIIYHFKYYKIYTLFGEFFEQLAYVLDLYLFAFALRRFVIFFAFLFVAIVAFVVCHCK